jgi:hypothetical protein
MKNNTNILLAALAWLGLATATFALSLIHI